MPNYKETTQEVSIQGVIQEWQRARQVLIKNDYGLVPYIVFTEEKITKYPDGRQTNKDIRSHKAKLDIPTKEFNLLNPETNEVVGTAKYADVYIMLYSLYMSLATEADNA